MAEYISNSKQDTVALGAKLAKVLNSGALVLFSGGLGAGKTAFCSGIAKQLECIDPVSSPTFSIVNVYRGKQVFAHFDMYRISTYEDLETAGFFDYLDEGAIVAAEWSENVISFIDTENAVFVEIEVLSENQRKISIKGATL